MYYAYSYAKNLNSCKCVSFLKENIDNIKYTEIFLMVMTIIGISINILVHLLGMDPMKGLSKSSLKIFGFFIGIYSIILISILINFIYNVYEFGVKFPSECDCADKWQKDILYIQAGWYSFTTISAVFLLSILMYRISSGLIKK
jgi:hypothetical protein